MRLGTDISSVFVRSAPTIAMAAACVDSYSKGQFVLGLGSSHKVQVEGEYGLPYSKPLTRIKETMEIAQALWRNGTASYKGDGFNIDHFGFAFKPYRKEIPIYLGAVFDKMMTLAESAKAAGRRASEVEITRLLTCYVTRDRRGVEAEVRQIIAYTCGFYPRYNRLIGEAGEGRERIQEHMDAGADLPILTFRAWSEESGRRVGRPWRCERGRRWRGVKARAAPP